MTKASTAPTCPPASSPASQRPRATTVARERTRTCR